MAAVTIVLVLATLASCTSQDCPDERIGTVRCVGNQLERCLDDNSLQYENCEARELVCSTENEACVHPDQLTSASSSGAGAGGAASSSGASSGGGGSGGR